jgi:hypothetical protein
MHQTRTSPPPSSLRHALQSDSWYTELVSRLAAAVGGIDALELLDVEPLPDEPFDWSAVSDQDRERVVAVLGIVGSAADERLDLEHRTIVRRILARVAANDPRPLRRCTNPTRIAAALVWLALHGNGELGRRMRWDALDVWAWFGVTSCADLGRGLLAAAGLGVDPDLERYASERRRQLLLGDAAVLHSSFRAGLLVRRTDLVATIERDAQRHADSRRIVDLGNGKVELRARPVEMLWAVKAMTATGRAQVIVAFGECDDDAEVVCMTVPQAHQLRNALQQALDASLIT